MRFFVLHVAVCVLAGRASADLDIRVGSGRGCHTSSIQDAIDASRTVDRIIGVFPKPEEAFVRARLASTFAYIVSQRLLPRADGKGRVAAIEILKSTGRTQEYIEKGEREGKSLIDAMNDGETEGMQSFDHVLEQLARGGAITPSTALAYATNRTNLQLAIHDILGPEDQ